MTISFKPRSRSRQLESTGNGSQKWSQRGGQKLSFGSLRTPDLPRTLKSGF